MSKFLYNTVFGRMILKVLVTPAISKIAGVFMNSKLSKHYINRFIKSNNIDMSDYILDNWSCFNEFFTRRLKNGKRSVDMHDNSLIAPCDGYLTIYDINPDSEFEIKNSVYSLKDLVKNETLAKEYESGICLVFRLTPSDYHRYIYPDNGAKGKNYYIPGKLHTVRPIAFNHYPVFKTNSREYTILRTNNFDDVVFMEVGAMMVGKICNYHQEHNFRRGEEKGRFEFGGSTIIMLLKKDIAYIDRSILDYLKENEEYQVKLGERIGFRM
ncbi:MAG: phosphatidylserine decarboxylase [Ruminococcaceae bacterium]|nr:phosphatidylserine decarboxylase [Oscillospiraceae bacterium]